MLDDAGVILRLDGVSHFDAPPEPRRHREVPLLTSDLPELDGSAICLKPGAAGDQSLRVGRTAAL
jgi:hypothetical protein